MTTELIFRYSEIYDQTLARLTGEVFENDSISSSYEYVSRYNSYWKQYNNRIFDFYGTLGFKLPNFWLGYFVHNRSSLFPFSDPLTQIMREDFEVVTASVVHELGHVFLDYYENASVYEQLRKHLELRYHDQDSETKVHLIVIILARYALLEMYGKEKTEQLLSLEKQYPGLVRAWKILDSRSEVFNQSSCINAIMQL